MHSHDGSSSRHVPAEILARAGIRPSDDVIFDVADGCVRVWADRLRKVYVEPTTACNLDCRMCVRRTWDEPVGTMPFPRFERLISGLAEAGSPPILTFGGYGEPLMHPELLRMIRAARGAGHPVEVITNGLLLDEAMAKQLVDADVAQVTVSIDGGDLGTYADARGCELDQAVSGLSRVLKARLVSRKQFPIGVAFVLSRRNVASLPVLIDTTGTMGVDFILVSNVVPHTEEMAREALWLKAAWSAAFASDSWKPRLKLAPIDLEEATRAVAEHVARLGPTFPPPALGDSATARRCRFVHEGMAAVAWDGRVAPCLSLLRSHPEYVAGRVKDVVRHEVGNVDEMSLPAIWAQEDYRSFRTRVRTFGFPDCFMCGGCPLTENNQTDCFGNPAPTCGECLWAYGLVQCP